MDWQTLIAAVIVAIAVIVLARQAWHFASGKKSGGSKSGGCASCPSNTASSRVKSLPLVQLGRPDKLRK